MNLISFYDTLAEVDFFRQTQATPLDRLRLHALTIAGELWPFSCPVGALTTAFAFSLSWVTLTGVEVPLSLDVKRVNATSGKYVVMLTAQAVSLPGGGGYLRLDVTDTGGVSFSKYSDVMCSDSEATTDLVVDGGVNGLGGFNVIYSGINEV